MRRHGACVPDALVGKPVPTPCVLVLFLVPRAERLAVKGQVFVVDGCGCEPDVGCIDVWCCGVHCVSVV